MYAFSVGFALFGAVVCLSALATEHRPLLGLDGIVRSRRCATNRREIPPSPLVAAFASVTGDEHPRTQDDVDIHGVEAESDLETSPDISLPKRKGGKKHQRR
jgi:hypothetical protein